MADTWILRWNTRQEEKPKAIFPHNYGRYSYTTFGEDRKSFVLFDGYLFDKEIYKLSPEATDAECIASEYLDLKTDLFDKLRGGFALAIWDHANRRLIAGRDAMGINPFYYHWNGTLFLMSSNMDELLTQPEIDNTFNRVRISEYIQNIWNSHQKSETFYHEILRLPSAHYLTLHSRELTAFRYWDPIPPGFDWATNEEQYEFEPLLERAVSRCLSVGADSIALSGGYDSVSIAILAHDQLNGKKPLHALSLRFEGTNSDEGEIQLAVAQALGMQQTMKSTKDALEGRSFIEASLDLSLSSPCPVIGLWQAMYSFLLKSTAAFDLHNLLLGTGGDEMLIVDLAYGADRLAAFDLTGLWRFYKAMIRTSPFPAHRVAKVVFWDSAVKPELMSWANTTIDAHIPALKSKLRNRHKFKQPWIANNQELTENLKLRAETAKPVDITPGERRYISKIRDLPQSPMLMLELEQGASWAKKASFSLMYPYFDKDLIELLLRIHPEELLEDGLAKTPVRRLVKKRLPAVDIPKKKVDFTLDAHNLLRNSGKHVWRSFTQPLKLAQYGFVKPKVLSEYMDGYFTHQHNHWLSIWLIISTETWLRARST